MAYKRQIAYFDLIENEIKRGNAGFVKWEQYDECHILSVYVSGLTRVHAKEVSVYLEKRHPIGKLNIQNGRAEGTYLLTKGEKVWTNTIKAMIIPIDEERELVAVFEREESGSYTDENPKEEEPEVREELEVKPKAKEATERINLSTQNQQKIQADSVEKTIWERLQETHELIYPFHNDMGCYRIFPKDIEMLHANYHRLQNNQFLLHGYYNYRHLIICKKADNENEFWLGVPGIYHEREKMAARMFGFEKFEGTTQDYRVGDLGYYLITVEG